MPQQCLRLTDQAPRPRIFRQLFAGRCRGALGRRRPSPTYGYHLLSAEVHALAEYAPGLAIALGADSQGSRGFRLRLADMSETQVPTGSDLSTPFTYLAPNVFAHYEQTNVLRLTEYLEAGKELLRETVGPNLLRRPVRSNAVLAYCRESRLIALGPGP
jgi:hypothetical protein